MEKHEPAQHPGSPHPRRHLFHIGLTIILMLFTALAVEAYQRRDARLYTAIETEKRVPNKLNESEGAPKTRDLASAPVAVPWNIHFWAVPLGDDALHIFTGQTGALETEVNADVGVAGAARRRFAMTYNMNESAYEAVAAEILIPSDSEGDIGLSSELDGGQTLSTGPIDFRRFFVPVVNADPVVSADNLLEMSISDNSLPAAAYVIVMATNALPGPLPLGHRLIGNPYAVRPSGAIISSTKPLDLRMWYSDTTLGSVDPHTLTILQWDPVAGHWEDAGGTLLAISEVVSTTLHRFTAYGLVSTTRWLDTFNDFSGLSVRENTTVLLSDNALRLDGLSLTGTAVSHPITPTTDITGWGSLTFTRTVPAGTSLIINVLDANNNPLLTDVAPGTSLASIDPALHPSLKLQANFSTDDLAKTALLEEWMLTWLPLQPTIYLPLTITE